LKERIKIPPRYEHCTLDSYGPLNFSQTRALAEARRFAERYPNVERGLIFVGGSGVGKSHLAVGIVQQLLQRFKDDLLFVEFPALLQLQLALAGSGSRLDVDWNRLRRVSLLLLDDFGLVNPTDENVYHAEELLRARMEAGRITIYTGGRLSCRELVRGCPGRDTSATHTFLSALSPEVLVRFLAVNRLVSLVGEDYRKKTASMGGLF
jgi:DNA replication protein DnaC